MELSIFIEEHWNLFVRHLCRFHPLSAELITRYADELDWPLLSGNRSINWSPKLVRVYTDRLVWVSVSPDPEEAKDLAQIGAWLATQPIDSVSDQVSLTRRLLKRLDPDDQPTEAERNFLERQSILQPEDLSDQARLEAFLINNPYKQLQPLLYQQLIAPGIDNNRLMQLFSDRFDREQCYFRVEPIRHDEHGLMPDLDFTGTNLYRNSGDASLIHDDPGELIMVPGRYSHGPERYRDAVGFSGSSLVPAMIVSEGLKQFLKQFDLPVHRFHPVTVKPKKGKTNTSYFLFQLESDQLRRDLDYSKLQFSFKKDRRLKDDPSLGFPKFKPVPEPINSFEDLTAASRNYEGYKKEMKCDRLPLLTHHDLYSFGRNGDLIVTEFLRQQLEKAFPGQFDFSSASDLNIVMATPAYAEKRNAAAEVSTEVEKASYQRDGEVQFYMDKMERLKQHGVKLPEDLIQDDEFAETERKLGVLFPEAFKDFFRKSFQEYEVWKQEQKEKGARSNEEDDEWEFDDDWDDELEETPLDVGGYRLEGLDYFGTDTIYYRSIPQAYKAVFIGGNGAGDYLGLILERDSDFKLQRTFYEFLHEEGTMEELFEF